MKKFLFGVLFVAMAFTIVGCGSKNTEKPKDDKKETKEKIKGNCTVFECIKELKVTDSLEEVNTKIGFEGKLDKETDNYSIYKWNVTKDSYVEIQFNTGGKSNIKIEFKKDTVADSKIDLSGFEEIKELVKSGEMDYATFVSKVGNVEGVLVEKSQFSKKYLWYNSTSKYLYGTFSESTNKCTLINGFYN